MGYDYRPRRTRALVDVDDLIVRANNIIIVGDRRRDNDDRVAGVEDEDRRNGDRVAGAEDVIDDILDEVCRRRRY